MSKLLDQEADALKEKLQKAASIIRSDIYAMMKSSPFESNMFMALLLAYFDVDPDTIKGDENGRQTEDGRPYIEIVEINDHQYIIIKKKKKTETIEQ